MPVAFGKGEGAGGQKDDMHLTLHAGPRMQHDYQAMSLTMVRSHLLLTSHMHASYALRHAFYPLCHDYQALLHSPHAYTHLHTKYIFHAECNCISTCIYVMVKRILVLPWKQGFRRTQSYQSSQWCHNSIMAWYRHWSLSFPSNFSPKTETKPGMESLSLRLQTVPFMGSSTFHFKVHTLGDFVIEVAEVE